jgi:hypothetical protein
VRLLLVATLPLAAIAAWAGWRLIRGRPVRRFALNAVVGVALLGYFSITAGLGIFWGNRSRGDSGRQASSQVRG